MKRRKITNLLIEVTAHIAVFLFINILFVLVMRFSLLDITGIYYYDGIFAMVTCVIPTEIIMLFFRKYVRWDYKDVIISFLLCISFLFVLLSVVLVTLDRSYSVFILSYIDSNQQTHSSVGIDELEYITENIFVDDYGMLDRRIREQIVSGNLQEIKGGVAITKHGHEIVKIFRMLAEIYGLDTKYIYP